MKNKNKNISKFSELDSLLQESYETDKMISIKNKQLFLMFISKISYRILVLITGSPLWTCFPRIKMIHNFANYLFSQYKKKGVNYVIAYLKASQLSLSKFVAREPLSSLQVVDNRFIFPRLAHGIPKIIGPNDRISIRRNNRKTIILWMTIFGLFRVLTGSYKLIVNTISDPFSGNQDFLEQKSRVYKVITPKLLRAVLRRRDIKELRGLMKVNQYLTLQSSGPSTSPSWAGLLLDIVNLNNMGSLLPILKWIAYFAGDLIQPLLTIAKIVLNNQMDLSFLYKNNKSINI